MKEIHLKVMFAAIIRPHHDHVGVGYLTVVGEAEADDTVFVDLRF